MKRGLNIVLEMGDRDVFRLVDSLDATEATRDVVKSLIVLAWDAGLTAGSGSEYAGAADGDQDFVGFPAQSGPQAMEWARSRLPVLYKAEDIRQAVSVVVDTVLGVDSQQYRRDGYDGPEYREAAVTVARLEAVAGAVEGRSGDDLPPITS